MLLCIMLSVPFVCTQSVHACTYLLTGLATDFSSSSYDKEQLFNSVYDIVGSSN